MTLTETKILDPKPVRFSVVSSFLNITSAIPYLLEEGQQVVLIYLYVCLHVSTIIKGKKETIEIDGKRKRVWSRASKSSQEPLGKDG